MSADDKWVTWQEAAELADCPVSTVDWYSRTGRIAHRPHHGPRPTLELASVEEFATWWTARQATRAARRFKPATRVPPGLGWLTSLEAAERLGLSVSTVRRLSAGGELDGHKGGGRLWISEESVDRLEVERSRWISYVTAAELVNVSYTTLPRAVASGELSRRRVDHALPSLHRDEVLTWAEQRRASKDKARQRRLEARAVAGPPDDGRVWLDVETAALVLQMSPRWVRMLAAHDRVPHLKRGRRLWFVREHVEQMAAARVTRSCFSQVES